jgi:hypothetical protein
MANLISPGVSVTIVDESFFIPGRVTTLPVIFIATADEKMQPDGESPALGTFEHGVYREVTSIAQSVQLYGVPRYLESMDGEPHHGDARNEYGLDALNKFLEIGNRAFVVRANLNLDDRIISIRNLWDRKITEAGDLFTQLAEEYIEEYNTLNNLFPSSPNYKESLTASEVKELYEEVLEDVFDSYSFSAKDNTFGINLFAEDFMKNRRDDFAGFAEIIFNTQLGHISRETPLPLDDGVEYGADIEFDNLGDPSQDLVQFRVMGEDLTNVGDLLDELNLQLGNDPAAFDPEGRRAEIISGRIRITSGLKAVGSDVVILDGPSGVLPIFENMLQFLAITPSVPGGNSGSLPIFEDGYENDFTGEYWGLYSFLEETDPSDNPFANEVTSDEFTPQIGEAILLTAAAEYAYTQEFRNHTRLGTNDADRRAEIVSRLRAAINNPDLGIRNPDAFNYNLLACPGYPEVANELIRLANDMLEEVFVLGETPFDKPPTGFDGVGAWATNERPSYPGLAYWYGHGLSSNIDGREILTTSSATGLRVIAFNDRERALWWAPAGTQRGQATHISETGYVSGTLGGPTAFVRDDLDVGARDSLYEFPKNINPITRIEGRGILVLGQKTASPVVSARESINVERLLRFIKRELRRGLFPFLFEPNDQITRNLVKSTVDAFLSGLMNDRALYDFATICDETNNTPDRIDRKELWVDVALKPVRAIEFIYVPLRVVATGADIGTGGSVEAV